MPVIINSLISSALIVLLMYLDRYEKENIVTMAKVFVLSILVTGFYSILMSIMSVKIDFNEIVLLAPLREEFLKFGLFIIVWKIWKRELNESFDAIMFMGMIALGFAFYENIAYYLNATIQGAVIAYKTLDFTIYNRSLYQIFLARLLPGHLFFDMIAITIFGVRLGKPQSALYLIPAFLVASLLHGIWNFLAAFDALFSVYGVVLFALAVFCAKKLLKISVFRHNGEFGDESIIPASAYDWSYYLMSYIFIIISGCLAIFVSYIFSIILVKI
ncbi:MAG: PrsW family intramembrane metalloprotease [Candidatus Cloacimonetes bacterium]|nr:PrsW family intramembrane metalloprotease [Candidatus Cloacimonadota bacterium]